MLVLSLGLQIVHISHWSPGESPSVHNPGNNPGKLRLLRKTKLPVKSVSKLVGSKWLVLVTVFCQSLVLCIYRGLSGETTWILVKLCILHLKSHFTTWKGKPRIILTLVETGSVKELFQPEAGAVRTSFVEFVCSLHLCVLLIPWEEKRPFQSKGCLCKAPWKNVWTCPFLKWHFVCQVLFHFYMGLEIVQSMWLLKSLYN